MPHTCSYSFFYLFLLLKKPCLRWWNHSSMSLFWNAIVLTGDQAQSCKSRYLSCEKRETLRSTKQSKKEFDLPSLAESCEKRETLRSTKQSKKEFDLPSLAENCEKREMLCSTRHACKTRIHSSLEQQFFLKCCCSSGWIWTVTKIYWWDWWWESEIHGLHCEMG